MWYNSRSQQGKYILQSMVQIEDFLLSTCGIHTATTENNLRENEYGMIY